MSIIDFYSQTSALLIQTIYLCLTNKYSIKKTFLYEALAEKCTLSPEGVRSFLSKGKPPHYLGALVEFALDVINQNEHPTQDPFYEKFEGLIKSLSSHTVETWEYMTFPSNFFFIPEFAHPIEKHDSMCLEEIAKKRAEEIVVKYKNIPSNFPYSLQKHFNFYCSLTPADMLQLYALKMGNSQVNEFVRDRNLAKPPQPDLDSKKKWLWFSVLESFCTPNSKTETAVTSWQKFLIKLWELMKKEDIEKLTNLAYLFLTIGPTSYSNTLEFGEKEIALIGLHKFYIGYTYWE